MFLDVLLQISRACMFHDNVELTVLDLKVDIIMVDNHLCGEREMSDFVHTKELK